MSLQTGGASLSVATTGELAGVPDDNGVVDTAGGQPHVMG